MKNIMLFFTLILLSCNAPNGDVKPDGREQIGWDAGKPVYQEYVVVHPSWSQSVYYGLKSGISIWGIVGILGLGGAITTFVILTRRGFVNSLREVFILVFFLAFAIVGFWSVGGEVHTDNDIRVTKEYYESFKGDLQAMWEDLYQSGRIKGTVPK